ncbi:SDR family oxidoreductase [Ornithinimicrobium sufpigmenti]|nr:MULTISPECIES: SDR family oxidoreductase [unclassified Ornithinimicrobium]
MKRTDRALNSSGRGVLVTGGCSGIGAAVARAHARLGDHVVVLDRDPPQGSLPADVIWVGGDVTTFEDNARAVQAVLDIAGRLDHFVGNAGIHDGGISFRDTSGAEIAEIAHAVLGVNVIGYLLGARAAVGALQESSGCMTFTLSDASYVVSGNGSGAIYSASKHGALGVVRHLAAELAPRVRVNAVAPGGVVTRLRATVPDGSSREIFDDPNDIERVIADFNPLGVVMTADELADLYLFLSSPQARGMTGEVLRPDGGLSVRTTTTSSSHEAHRNEGIPS